MVGERDVRPKAGVAKSGLIFLASEQWREARVPLAPWKGRTAMCTHVSFPDQTIAEVMLGLLQ